MALFSLFLISLYSYIYLLVPMKGSMMKTTSVLIISLVLGVTLIMITSQNNSEAATALRQPKWEYGIYQVKVGDYEFEWINDSDYIYGDSQESFFFKLGMQNSLTKIENKYAQRHPLPLYIFNTAFLNYLADQGWELVETWGNYKESVTVYTLRRAYR